MTPDLPARAGLHPSIVLSAYIEPLLRGRRVAVIGDATTGLAEELSKRGARLVHAYDPDQPRTAEAMARNQPGQQYTVNYAVLTPDLGVRDGAFDIVIVPDLSLFPDPADILRRARRLIGPAGAAVIATPNLRGGARRLIPELAPPSRGPAPPGYYELYDLVSLQFPKVRMVGQAPFVGYTVADFAPHGEPDVSVDTSFLPTSEEPEHFIAIASDRALTIDAYTVVALPWTQIGEALADNPTAAAKHEEDRLALGETRNRLALMSAELEKLRDRQHTDARDAEARAASAATLSARVVELELALEARDGRLRELEARAGDNHVRAERLAHQVRDLEEELRHQRDRATRLSKQLDDEKKARTKAELELGMIRGVPPGNPKDRERIDALTAELEAARARIAEIEQDQTATQRRGQLAPPVVTEANAAAETKLRTRISELETAVNNALREATAATAARDTALERLRRMEERAERTNELEVSLTSSQRSKEALTQQNQALEARRVDADRRVTAIERELAETRAKLVEQDLYLVASRRKVAEAEQRHAEDRTKLAELERRIEAVDRLRGERDAERERAAGEIARREAELAEAKGLVDEANAEITALEATLRERGHAISAIKRDLHESERIGKELVAELEAARGLNGASAAAASIAEGETAAELRARLDTLAESAARAEADLQAARWHIAKLERELTELSAAPREASAVQMELEAALSAARDEVAALRRSIGG